MKKFSEYLLESVKEYKWNVKLSFKPDSEVLDKIERALGKYNLVSITAPKSLPIKRVDKDFPGINSPETYVFTINTAYPSTPRQIQRTIAALGLALETISVTDVIHDEVTAAEEDLIALNTSDGGSLLQTELTKDNNKEITDNNYGDKYNEKLVKNSIGSTDQLIPKEFKKIKGQTLNDLPAGKDSAMGSKQNKIPTVKSFSR